MARTKRDTMATRKVTIETRTVGQCFATCGVICDARTGRELAEGQLAPYQFTAAAADSARAEAERRGWVVVENESDE